MDQRYFYDWEYFRETEEANKKPAEHLKWTNNKPMRIFKGKTPNGKADRLHMGHMNVNNLWIVWKSR